MSRQRNMSQEKQQNKTPGKERNRMETSNLLDVEFKPLVIGLLPLGSMPMLFPSLLFFPPDALSLLFPLLSSMGPSFASIICFLSLCSLASSLLPL